MADFPKIIVLNIGGGHGNFLRYSLDKFSTHTPTITTSPFNELGNSHKKIKYSDYFVFEKGDTELNFKDENIIFIDIDGEPLYFERACIYRSGDAQTNLFSEEAIAKFLKQNGSTFPDFCKSQNMTLKDGYMHGFKNLDKQGSMVFNKQRYNRLKSQNNNIFRYNISNFFSLEKYKKSFADIGAHFQIHFNLEDCADLYNEFHNRNQILRTHNRVNEYLNGNTDVELDILQQAYVDAHKK